MKVEKWIHINYEENDKWLFPIFNELRTSLRLKDDEILDQNFIELSYHISTRLEILPIICDRLNVGFKRIIDNCKEKVEHINISSEKENGYVLEIDEKVKYSMILDIDSFLFEINSCLELITKLIKKIYSLFDQKVEDINEELKQLLIKKGQDIEWYRLLDSGRNFFIHEGTPFFAIDYTNHSIGQYDILIMKENINSFEQKKKYYRLSDFNKIISGFHKSKNIIAEYLIIVCKKYR
jgi:hypothetical protein